MTWRDGVHLTGTPIWCDARRRRDVCFVSSADRVVKAGHGQLIGTPTTLALLDAEKGGHLAVPPLRPFTLGVLRLELIPSGHGLGAAALHVDLGARTVLYAGAVRTTGPGEMAQVRNADAVVVAAPVSEAKQTLSVDEAGAKVAAWANAQIAAKRRPVLITESASDAFEVATRLAAEGIAVAATKSVRDAAARVAAVAQVPALKSPSKELGVVVRVEGERLRLGDEQVVRALVSSRAFASTKTKRAKTTSEFDLSFAWPFVASYEQLLAWIEQTRASEVFVTGEAAELIAGKLGSKARVLGPPHQMPLFPAEAR